MGNKTWHVCEIQRSKINEIDQNSHFIVLLKILEEHSLCKNQDIKLSDLNPQKRRQPLNQIQSTMNVPQIQQETQTENDSDEEINPCTMLPIEHQETKGQDTEVAAEKDEVHVMTYSKKKNM